MGVILEANYQEQDQLQRVQEVFKIDNLAAFYLDSMVIGNGEPVLPVGLHLRNGFRIGSTVIGRRRRASSRTPATSGTTRTTPTRTTAPDLIAAGLLGTTARRSTFRPKPAWLDRLVFFDIANDSPTSSRRRTTTRTTLPDSNLQGADIGTSVCPERVITDPCVSDREHVRIRRPGRRGRRGWSTASALAPTSDWLFQRDQDNTFVWEDFGFYSAITPLVKAFATAKNPSTGQPRHREDLFIALMEVLHKHWQTAQGTADECTLYQTGANPPPARRPPRPPARRTGRTRTSRCWRRSSRRTCSQPCTTS